MAFLAKLLSMLIPTVLDWFYRFARKKASERQAEKEIELKNSAMKKKLESAETPKEREDVAKDVTSNF